MRRVRGVVPLGMLMMYLPSISAVTRRRFTAGKPVPSSAGWLMTDTQSGVYMRIKQRQNGKRRKTRNTRLTDLKGQTNRRVGVVKHFSDIYQLWCFCSVARWTQWQIGGCQVDGREWPVGNHCSRHWQSYEWQLSRRRETHVIELVYYWISSFFLWVKIKKNTELRRIYMYARTLFKYLKVQCEGSEM